MGRFEIYDDCSYFYRFVFYVGCKFWNGRDRGIVVRVFEFDGLIFEIRCSNEECKSFCTNRV